MANNPAYATLSTDMPVQKFFSEDDKLSSKVLEEDHEYDYIPATFSGHQYGGPAAKTNVQTTPSSYYEMPIVKNW